MAKIWKKDRAYSLLRLYVDYCTRSSFKSIKVVGRENIPNEGAVILAPNHCNTLMDALVVLQANSYASAYGARADVFKKKKVGQFLRFLRILPMARERDGLHAVAGNLETFDEVVECIDHGVPFCIFSEGTHRAKRSLQPIKKGVFRIAFKAARKLDKPVYIVPTGLDYSDFFRYMKSATVRFGEPINISEYIAANPDKTDPEMYQELSKLLYRKISELFTFFPDDESYEANVEAWRAQNEKKRGPLAQAGRILLAILSLPFYIIFAILCCPMWIAASIFGNRLKDKAWLNTVRFATKLVFLPLLTILVGVPAFIFMKWWKAIILLVLLLLAHSGFYFLHGFYQDLYEDLRK